MKLILVAVGTRMPGWVDTGFDDFAKRMPRELPLQLIEVKAEPRTTGKTAAAMMAAEAARIEAVLPQLVRLTPRGIREHLGLNKPIYQKSAAYGHFGREEPEFTWERTDKAQTLRKAAGLA